MFLYYILAFRLRNKQPTFFQFRKDFIILFNDSGVELLSPNFSVPNAPAESWVLIDLNTSVESVPEIFIESAYFVVIAAPPHPRRWKSIQHYRPDIKMWFMEPFTLEELIQAREFDRHKLKEQDIQAFFEKYGPSARECFAWCSDLEYYDTKIRARIASVSWDTLTKALTTGVSRVGLSEGFHEIFLVTPEPEDPSSARVTVVTKYVNELLWDKDATARRQNHCQLYRTLRLVPASKAVTGELFAPAFQRLCVKGNKKVILHPMNRASVGPINYEFVTSQETVSETLELHPRILLTFNRRNPIPSLNANRYYRPTVHSYGDSYDSFIYDPNFSRVTAFQVTDAINHAIKPKGLYDLHNIARQSGINVNGLNIRFIIVTSEGSAVTSTVEKTVYDDLELEMYSLEMTKSDLYDE
ncbi:hypothetical protein BC826DRAFT_122476 [Russula brevipes]|nr:hypothetical protein BC826DRAFT_122476 [Russula brevipes]